jgi:hypothetical protein
MKFHLQSLESNSAQLPCLILASRIGFVAVLSFCGPIHVEFSKSEGTGKDEFEHQEVSQMRVFAFFGLVVGLMLIGVSTLGSMTFQSADGSGPTVSEDGKTVISVEDIPSRRLRNLIESIGALQNGIFKSSPADIPDFLPDAPEGWSRLGFEFSQVEAIIGVAYEPTPLDTTTNNRILKHFGQASQMRRMGGAATYDTGSGLIAIRIEGDLDAIRNAERGTPDTVRQTGTPFVTVDDVIVYRLPKVTTTTIPDTYADVAYDRFTARIGAMVEVEIISTAEEEDLQMLVNTIDFAALKAALPPV